MVGVARHLWLRTTHIYLVFDYFAMTSHRSSLWLLVAFAVGLGLGCLVGWRAHVARMRYLRSKRDYYEGKALEFQRTLEQ